MHEVYSKNPDIVFRKIADEFILVPIKQKAADLRCIYTLNETAAFIWELLDGARAANDIKARVMEEFEVDPSQAEPDISEMFDQLESLSLIQKA